MTRRHRGAESGGVLLGRRASFHTIGALITALVVAPATAAPLGPDGDPGRMHPGKVVWLDLATEDPAAAKAFYGAVFDWRFRDVHAGGKRTR
jgi:hypothetical protein